MLRRSSITYSSANDEKRMSRVPPLTPGRLTALWVVLRTLARFGGGAKAGALKALAGRTALRSGGLPIEDGFELGVVGGLLVQNGSESVRLGPTGSEALSLDDEDEPNPEVLRLFLSVFTLADPPAWVAYWQGDPSSLDLVVPQPERRLLVTAGLLPPPDRADLTAWGWWKALSLVPRPDETAAVRKIIGDAGEALSLEYERRRLIADGFPELARRVRPVGRESPAYGFDIASFWGLDAMRSGKASVEPGRALAIEVKSTSLPARNRFPLYLSSHEWEVTQELGGNYLFHLWDGVSPHLNPTSRRNDPIIATPGELAEHLPKPPSCAEVCRWESAYIGLPVDGVH